MLDIDKDIEVEIIINVAGKRRALANLKIGNVISVNGFEIIQADKKRLYVVNPHIISSVYNKTALKREITYLSTASLLEHQDRKKIIDKILDSYAEKIEELKKAVSDNKVSHINIVTGSKYEKEIDLKEKRDYSI